MKKEFQIILDYVEGRMSAEEFHKELMINKALKQTLKYKYDIKYQYLQPYNYNLYDYFNLDHLFEKSNWNNVRIQYVLQAELADF